MTRTRYSASSRYELDDGNLTATRRPEEDVVYIVHVVEANDTVENIAHRILGDHTRWWEIVDLNPQLCHTHCGSRSALNLVPGDPIRIPT